MASPSAIPSSPLPQLPSAGTLLAETFKFYRSHWYIIGGIALIPSLFFILSFLLDVVSPPFAIIFYLVFFVVQFFSRLALFIAVAQQGQPLGGIWGAFSRGFTIFGPFVWVSFLVSLVSFGGFLLFIIPGIFLSIMLSLSMYILVSENSRGFSALVASWSYVKGYWGAVFIRFIAFLLCVFVLIIIFGLLIVGVEFANLFSGAVPQPSFIGQFLNLILGDLILTPLGIIYMYFIYGSLQQAKAAVPLDVDREKIKKSLFIFMGISILFFVVILGIVGFSFFSGFSNVFSLPGITPSLFASFGFSPFVDFILAPESNNW